MHLFYTPDIQSNLYTLSEEESKHAIRVLRMKIGDQMHLVNGTGTFYEVEIIDDSPKRCAVKVISQQNEFGKRTHFLHIAIAPTKSNDRTEWFIEKATEIGIDEISFIDCNKSERAVIKHDRVQKVAVSAIKQSVKAYLPQLNEMTDFKKFIAQTKDFAGQKFIAHCHERAVLPHLKNEYTIGNNALVAIGPEGDFSVEEVALAIQNGFKEISLGAARLRTETAALYACTTINVLNEK